MDIGSLMTESPVVNKKPIEATDGTATSYLENDNNNLKSPLISAKHNNIFLENNLPLPSGGKPVSPLTLDDDKRSGKPKTKTLAETIENLKQSAVSLSYPTYDSLAESHDVATGLSHNSKFSSSSYYDARDRENNESSTNHSLISCDIICNCDGTVYVTSSSLSSRLLTPDGVLNEPSDSHCSPFPVSTKCVRYCHNDGVLCYSIDFSETGQQIKTPTGLHFIACLLCRSKYTHVDHLILHGVNVHSLSSLQRRPYSTSAVIQQVRGQSPTLQFMKFDEIISTDSLLAKVETEARVIAASTRTSSITTPPGSAKALISGAGSQRNNYTSSGFCEDHPDGGIECPKCDLTLSSTRSLGGHMTMMHSRNSCKTLKCPKCNWHYKYQETLEIHMKEKHPDTEQTCIYCVTKQSHPRLTRGESYMCGYKPYRCEVCNYSTTTKGNLSIHMQSDKHINNIQELQNIGSSGQPSGSTTTTSAQPLKVQESAAMSHAPSPTSNANTIATASPPPNSAATHPLTTVSSNAAPNRLQQKVQKWRCDVCNYETNIARNLRIHMTSEKHSHNMVILQQNVRSMQRNITFNSTGMASGQPDAATLQHLGTMFPFDPLGIVGQLEAFSHQQGDVDHVSSVDSVLSLQSKIVKRDVYGCAICNVFTTDDLANLDAHINIDRSATNNAEHVTITPENHYLCNLCEYKTPLKANFQLHCKTDKHVQRVQLVNHMREGGSEAEWRMRYINIPNPVHIACNVCNYQSNSIHKMRVHSLPLSHVIGASLFVHLRRMDEASVVYHYTCGVCVEITLDKASMVTHVRKVHASQIEQLCRDGWNKFSVKSGSPVPLEHDGKDSADAANSSPSNAQQDLDKYATKMEMETDIQESNVPSNSAETSHQGETVNLVCQLCSDKLTNINALKRHLFNAHNVTEEGAKKLLAMLDTSSWKTRADDDSEEIYRCQTCTKTFTDFEDLCQHQNELGHLEMKPTPRGPGYLCWKKGCNQYFKSNITLQTHFREIHARPSDPISAAVSQTNKPELKNPADDGCKGAKDYTTINQAKCDICDHVFRSITTLRKHTEVTHMDTVSGLKLEGSMEQMSGTSGVSDTHFLENNRGEGNDKEEPDLVIDELEITQLKSFIPPQIVNCNSMGEAVADNSTTNNSSSKSAMLCRLPMISPVIKVETARRDDKPYKCIVCNVCYAVSGQLDQHLVSSQHQEASASLTRKTTQSRICSLDAAASTFIPRAPQEPADVAIASTSSSGEIGDSKNSVVNDIILDKLVPPPPTTTTTVEDIKPVHSHLSANRAIHNKEAVAPASSDHSQMSLCRHCNSKFVSHDALLQHQKLSCSGIHASKRTRTSRNNCRKLLQTFGIECVMGFLESEQHKDDQRETTSENLSGSETNLSDDEYEGDLKSIDNNNTAMTMLDTLLPPEMNSGKLTCSDCGQMFSGIWVLKTHKEEEHDQILPDSITSHFAALYKKEFEKKEKEASLNAANQILADSNISLSEAMSCPPLPVTTQAAEAVKTEPLSVPISNAANTMQGLTSNPMDLLNYPAMNPWLSMFQFGMMPPGAMFNPMVPPPSPSVTNVSSKTPQPNNLASPPMIRSPSMENNPMLSRQHSIQPINAQMNGEKRARTRISDDQLKVLRQYFDINNSPSEESIMSMAAKTGLPAKVIKHWFRNTLFKERQRNKDSPYNFNNPPQTTLNLEEYEKTGRVPEKTSTKFGIENICCLQPTETIPAPKEEVFSPAIEHTPTSISNTPQIPQVLTPIPNKIELDEDGVLPNASISKYDDGSVDSDFDKPSAYPTSSYDIDSDHEDPNLMSPGSPLTSASSENMGGGASIFSKMFGSPYKFHEYSSSAASKRANRTRFTDFQIKTLQDYFEQNAYPKDEELEQLSRVLQLPNRVIVVWFQNARQKARKVYENNPSAGTETAVAASPVKSTYPCKKCGVVFTGYYELVKHQKRVCMKNNIVPLPFGNQDGQVAVQSRRDTPGRERQHSLTDTGPEAIRDITTRQTNTAHGLLSPTSSAPLPDSIAAATVAAAEMATMLGGYGNNSNLSSLFMPFMPMPGVLGASQSAASMQNVMKDLYEQSMKKYLEESQKLNAQPSLPKSEPTPSIVQPVKSGEAKTTTGENSSIFDHASDITQQQKVIQTNDQKPHQALTATSSVGDDEGSLCDSDMGDDQDSLNGSRVRTASGGHSSSGRLSQNKRYRTNLTNMQIHVMKYLFRDYKTPTMAECEILGGFIGLQKRVVQVWFQNARAKEKKNKAVGSSTNDDDPLVTECSRCGVTYSPKCSIQEHIFSSRHINQLRSTFNGKLTECDREAIRKQAEVHRPPQNSRRVSNSLGRKSDSATPKLPLYSPTSSSTSLNAVGRGMDYQTQLSRNLLSSLNPMSGMMGLPGADMLSLMYPNMLQQMPSFLPGLLPGGFGSYEQSAGLSSLYNSIDFGTPLSLLQIPQAAIRSISSKLSDTDCPVAEYSQDCSGLKDLYSSINKEDISMVKTSHADVGFACRQCQFVFPRKESCINHQSTSCYVGRKSSCDTLMKIVQLQFTCLGCKDTLATVQEFKNHCITEAHRYRRSKLNNNNNESEPPSAKKLKIV